MSTTDRESQKVLLRPRFSSMGALAVVLAMVVSGVAAPAQAYQLGDMVYDRQLTTDAKFFDDWAIPAIDPTTGNVFVADMAGDRVVKLDSSGAVSLTLDDSQIQKLDSPRAVAVDAQGNIFVADGGNHRVVKFNSGGKPVDAWGGNGIADGKFNGPSGIAVDADGFIYVADTSNHRIQKFDGDGNWKDTWGQLGDGKGEFTFPMGIAVTSSGDLAIADLGNARVQVLHSDGTFALKFGSFGTAPGEFTNPSSVATDAEGRFYVSDLQNPRVTVFTPWGSLLGQQEFFSSVGVAVDALAGRLYVAGRKNNSEDRAVHVYRSAQAAEFTAGPRTSATAGKAYASTLKTSGFPAVGHFELVAGKLPAGLAIVGGKVVGVPTRPGSYPIVLRADNAVTPSGWGAYTITIGKASARVTAKLSTKRPRAGATRVKARIRISAPYTTGLSKTGKVRVFYGKKRMRTYTIKASNKGVIKVSLPKFAKKGKTKITLRYLGNSQLRAAKRTITVRVR